MSNNTDNLKAESIQFQKTNCSQKSRFIPMLFSTPMVQAILEGRKTQTRRVIKPQPFESDNYSVYDKKSKLFKINKEHWQNNKSEFMQDMIECGSKIQIGDILWVRETFDKWSIGGGSDIIYKADIKDKTTINSNKWKPSLFMKKEYCRIWLKVTKVRIEKLCHITEEDSIAEGIERVPLEPFIVRYKDYMGIEENLDCPIESYGSLWDKINGTGSYNSNPYVWVYEFERLNQQPSDF